MEKMEKILRLFLDNICSIFDLLFDDGQERGPERNIQTVVAHSN